MTVERKSRRKDALPPAVVVVAVVVVAVERIRIISTCRIRVGVGVGLMTTSTCRREASPVRAGVAVLAVLAVLLDQG